jgi:hypothetical protein
MSYVVSQFADFQIENELKPFYIQVGYEENENAINRNPDSVAVGFAVDTRNPLGQEANWNATIGASQTYTAYFQAFFTHTEGTTRYIHWFDSQYYQAFWDAATGTLDFSGVYTWDGVDYDIIVAIVAFADIDNKKWDGAFSDGYKQCKLKKNPAGAPAAPAAFTGERVPLPRLNAPANGETWKSVITHFDPAKFSRKRRL